MLLPEASSWLLIGKTDPPAQHVRSRAIDEREYPHLHHLEFDLMLNRHMPTHGELQRRRNRSTGAKQPSSIPVLPPTWPALLGRRLTPKYLPFPTPFTRRFMLTCLRLSGSWGYWNNSIGNSPASFPYKTQLQRSMHFLKIPESTKTQQRQTSSRRANHCVLRRKHPSPPKPNPLLRPLYPHAWEVKPASLHPP